MKDKISAILYNYFGAVYCDTCESKVTDAEDTCYYCYRKNMKWSLSKEAADEVAEKIMKELGL